MSRGTWPASATASRAAWTKLRPSGTRAIRLVWLRKIVRALMGDRGLGIQRLPPPPLYYLGKKDPPSADAGARGGRTDFQSVLPPRRPRWHLGPGLWNFLAG